VSAIEKSSFPNVGEFKQRLSTGNNFWMENADWKVSPSSEVLNKRLQML
jgi:hypothetical protein